VNTTMSATLPWCGLLAVAVVVGCRPLERTTELGAGEVRVSVVDDQEMPVEGAIVTVPGSPRMAVSDADGLAVVRGLVAGNYALRIGIDDDGDGRDDRAAVRAADVAMVRLAELGGAGRLSSVITAPIELAPTGSIGGTVPGLLPSELARVVVVRRVTLGADERAPAVQLPVEGSAGVDVDGSFLIEGLAAGEVTLVALTWSPSSSPEPLQQLIAASRPSRFAVKTVDVGNLDVVVAELAPSPASVPLTVELGGDLSPVRNAGSVTYDVPQGNVAVSAALVGTIEGLASSSPRAAVEAPLSVFALIVDIGAVGVAEPVVGLPDVALLPVPVGLDPACGPREGAELGAIDGCGGDLDGDGVLDDDDDDDDGDGVNDNLEPTVCRTIGRGADRDGDCLCDAVDPFADCTSNDPVDCEPLAPLTCE
jgi:hypothetical protein